MVVESDWAFFDLDLNWEDLSVGEELIRRRELVVEALGVQKWKSNLGSEKERSDWWW